MRRMFFKRIKLSLALLVLVTNVLAEEYYGYLAGFILEGNTVKTDCLYLAHSLDGNNYEVLNNGKPVLYPLLGSKKFGSPAFFRKADGTFGFMSSDDNNSDGVLLYDSEDLITYTHERHITLSPDSSIKVMYPECKYHLDKNIYTIQWEGSNGKYYESVTADFVTVSSPVEIAYYQKEIVRGNLPTPAIEATVIGLTETEYKKVVNKYATIYNTEIVSITDILLNTGQEILLPEKVTVNYSDGSTKDMGVKWNPSDLEKIDTQKQGIYNIRGTIQQPEYPNILAPQRADPWVIKDEEGNYYFTATYPNDYRNEGYNCVILRKANTIQGLEEAEEVIIWNQENSDISYRYVWAPELHRINGTWYIFFTTSRSEDNVWDIRPIIIACNKGERDPMNPDCWETDGHYCEAYPEDDKAFQSFSLDMTYFEDNGKHYVAWAEIRGTSSVIIATIDPDQPWKLTSKSVLLTRPEYAWEWDNDWVNEGPAIIKNKGKIYMAFSASSVNETYCVGMLYADEKADLLNPDSWTKIAYPLLDTADLVNQSGPGHNSFTTDEYDNPVIVYHARTPGEPGDKGLNDPGRHARVKSLNFAADGTPILNLTPEQELTPALKEISIQVVIE